MSLLFRRVMLAVLTFVWLAPVCRADVKLPAIIGNHMVLQREMPLPIWGWAAAGEEVTVAVGDHKATTKAADDGKWLVKLPPLKGGAPVEMTITGKNTIKLTDILVGEVWVGSGQSNMQWSVNAVDNAQQEIAAANHPGIRLFSVPLVPAGVPANDVQASWQVCSPQTIAGFSAVAYFFGREIHKTLNVPVGMIATSWGGTRIEPWIPPLGFLSEKDLGQELQALKQAKVNYAHALGEWARQVQSWAAAAEKAAPELGDPSPMPPPPQHPLNNNSTPTGLYNGMVHALVPFAIRGALWYQGESNRGQGMHYHSLMKGLISGWRGVWGQGEFPFLFVQLAPYRYDQNFTALPEIWEAQTATLAVPNTGMAVTTDISNVKDIHPRNKQEVGRRLALWALAKTYNKPDVVYSGPQYASLAVQQGEVQIKFHHAEGGLIARDDKPLTWFTIAGDDKKFVPAVARIANDTVVVSSPQVPAPVAVRFAWHQIAEPNLANKAGLPAIPFRTDNWTDAKADNPEVR